MSIKVLHTSDWHLGKRLFKFERLNEQKEFLDWLYKYIVLNKVDILLVAGDIFDVPSPPNEALKVFYDFIFKLGSLESVKTFIITGNHDSSSLFEASKLLLERHNCFIYNKLSESLSDLEYIFEKDKEKIGLKFLPYFRNYELHNHLKKVAGEDENKIASFFQNFFSSWEQKELNSKILVAHHVFGNYELSGSEHAIYLSGMDHFPLDWVQKYFNYIALGHIHKRQELSTSPGVVYPGSPIPLRFSESNDKFITEITIENNITDYKFINIPRFRKLIQLNTDQRNLSHDIEMLKLQLATEDVACLLEVNINLNEPQTGLVAEINNMLREENIELISFIPNLDTREEKSISYSDVRSLNLTDLLDKFYYDKYNSEDVPKDVKSCFIDLINEVRNENSCP